MSIKIKSNIEVEITDLTTDNRYYSFRFSVFINGEFKKTGWYNSSHSWMENHLKFRKELRHGYAVKLALEDAL